MSYAGVVLIIVLTTWVARDGDARKGLWFGWIVALLLTPSWMQLTFSSLTLSPRRVAALTGLSLMFMMREKTARYRPMLSDVVAVLLTASMMITEPLARNGRPLVFADIALGWFFPYFAGRFFLGSRADLDRVLMIVGVSLAVLCAICVVEAFAHINLVSPRNMADYILDQEGGRFGMRRARGTLSHPIYLGMTLALMLPFALEAARRAKGALGPAWWRFLPGLTILAIVMSVSRGPIMVSFVCVFAHVFFRRRRLRPILIASALIMGAVGFAGREAIVPMLASVVGQDEEKTTVFEHDGEYLEENGTTHRLLLFRVYRDYIAQAGAFGYGRDLVGVELDEYLAKIFWSIDDHYINFLLQCGWLGITLFVLLLLAALANLARVAWPVPGFDEGLAGAMFGSIVGIAVMLFTVWFAVDFGEAFLFCAGLSANLCALAAEEAFASSPESAP